MTAEGWYEPARDLLLLCLGVWFVSTLGAIATRIQDLRSAIEAINITVTMPSMFGPSQRCEFRESAITAALDQHGRRERARELSLQLSRTQDALSDDFIGAT